MDILQMRKYVDLEIFKQDSASAKVLAPLFTAITIGEPAKTGDNLPSNNYKVTNAQADIDQVIDAANANHDLTHIAVLDYIGDFSVREV